MGSRALWWTRLCNAQSIQMSLDKRREHVCPIAGIIVVCLDEEGFKCRTNGGEGLVVPDEEAPCKRCDQHVEGTSNMRLIAEARAMIGRRGEPDIGRQRRSISRSEVAEVVVRHGDRARRVDSHRGRESWPVTWCVRVDLDWSAPGCSPIGRSG